MPRPRIYEEVEKETVIEELANIACDFFDSYDDKKNMCFLEESSGNNVNLNFTKIGYLYFNTIK